MNFITNFKGLENFWGRDSVVGIATRYAPDGSVFESRGGRKFSVLEDVQTDSGAHPASYRMRTGALSWR
jgi:hypothetical protein